MQIAGFRISNFLNWSIDSWDMIFVLVSVSFMKMHHFEAEKMQRVFRPGKVTFSNASLIGGYVSVFRLQSFKLMIFGNIWRRDSMTKKAHWNGHGCIAQWRWTKVWITPINRFGNEKSQTVSQSSTRAIQRISYKKILHYFLVCHVSSIFQFVLS